jgi:dTMP kinase
MKITYLIGTDGSGKTTLAHEVVRSLQEKNQKAAYVYCQHQHILLLPLRLLVRNTYLRSVNSKKNYTEYSEKKSNISQKNRFLSWAYVSVWLLDYWIATILRILPHLFRSQLLVIDRYYLDIVVNISQVMGFTNHEMFAFAQRVKKIFPAPDWIFFIDVPEEIAFSRKNDIDSIEYIRERRSRYDALSASLNFHVIDGTQTIEKERSLLIDCLELTPPHGNGRYAKA